MQNQDELDKVIAQLNQYLQQGFLIKQTYLRKHDIEGQKQAFDVDQLQKEYESEINKWLNEVANYLQPFGFRYFFHFYHVKGDALSIPHPLWGFTHALEKHLFALEDIIVWFEERKNLAVRKEIAEMEHEADTLYKITYSEHTREIKLNKMVLANPQSDSKAVNFFEYVYANPNKPIEVKDIEGTAAFTLSNNIQDILRDLGFKGNIRKVFFPVATKNKVMFVNPITKQYAIKNDLPVIKFSKDNETEREPAS